jgi:hypothetical protein
MLHMWGTPGHEAARNRPVPHILTCKIPISLLASGRFMAVPFLHSPTKLLAKTDAQNPQKNISGTPRRSSSFRFCSLTVCGGAMGPWDPK